MACVYASLSPATALLEYLAHLEGSTPAELLLAVGMIPAASVISEINEPSTWCDMPYRPEVQQVGASWLRSRLSLAMRVPSALCRDECNILLNPQHRDFQILQLVALRPLRVDERIRR
jgi:RES domain-containing protein